MQVEAQRREPEDSSYSGCSGRHREEETLYSPSGTDQLCFEYGKVDQFPCSEYCGRGGTDKQQPDGWAQQNGERLCILYNVN